MYIERDGARLFYKSAGTGSDLILLHPTPVDHEFWLPMLERLGRRFRCTSIDLRGHGQSTAGSGTISMQKLAEDVHAVVRVSGIQTAGFIGCSIGGYAMYEYWRRFPADVSTMTFICGRPQADSAENREKRKATIESLPQPGGLAKFFDSMADTLVGATAQKRNPEIRTVARAMMNRMSLDAAIAVQQGLLKRPDSVPTLGTMTVPVCAIAGGEDVGIPVSEMRMISDLAPNAEFHLIQDAGHYAPLEQPEHVCRIVERFLDRHPQPIHAESARKKH